MFGCECVYMCTWHAGARVLTHRLCSHIKRAIRELVSCMLSADVDAVARKLLIIAREGLSHTKHQNVMRISVLRWFLMWPQVRPQGPPIASHGRAHACGQYHPAVLWLGSAGARVLEARVPLQRRPAVGAPLPHHGSAMEVGRARHSLGGYGVSRMVLLLI